MKKEELTSDLLNVFASLSHMRTFGHIQTNLKGENFLLAHLFESGGESTPSKLAEFLDVSAARIAAILRSLEGKDFIERISDGSDKRRIMVKLTQDGKSFVELIQCEMIRHATKVLEALGEEDSAEFVRILKKIIYLDTQQLNDTDKK